MTTPQHHARAPHRMRLRVSSMVFGGAVSMATLVLLYQGLSLPPDTRPPGEQLIVSLESRLQRLESDLQAKQLTITEIKNLVRQLAGSNSRANSLLGSQYGVLTASKFVRCIKEVNDGIAGLVTLNQCKLTCGPFGVLWPQPQTAKLGTDVVEFLPTNVFLTPLITEEVLPLLREAFDIFKGNLEKHHPHYSSGSAPWSSHWSPSSAVHGVEVKVQVQGVETFLTLHTNESYELHIHTDGDKTTATIIAPNFFGARHALETLTQLVEYHENRGTLMIVRTASVYDAPAFKYRGLLLDTSRNFFSVAAIERTLDTMAANKLNTFHWHITDTHSFPLYLESLPNMAFYGAYTPSQIYHPHEVRHLVQYARVRGIRIVPELDAPAHVGNGWQWGETHGLGKLAVCVNKEPWLSYCFQPPCGQLNLANPNMYTVMAKIYKELAQVFSPVDLFHFGGDEVNLNCWNTTEEITSWMTANNNSLDVDAYYDQWGVFQEKAYQLLTTVNKAVQVTGILWSSGLTGKERVERYLSNSKYIIQIWTKGSDPVIAELLRKNYRVIFSNYDSWYLACGAADWMSKGNNWCSPYQGWHVMYDNSPHDIARNLTGSPHSDLVLGGEAALWSEQIDEASMDAKRDCGQIPAPTGSQQRPASSTTARDL
ncbi:Chitooligosaccharidolytic beta-N-acetylglucosaminidase-like 6 [Homarus americanus]|uniref:beta-N-acetylhexosaminidase n=1 Tax=Homarus americanus TaxID=6706 RepID=A0A8J5MQG6_HOMAM|nr:Chitooligosaccharidolytic beta-N-acetylglucosaminidase-like 6 [Homarus americanus]